MAEQDEKTEIRVGEEADQAEVLAVCLKTLQSERETWQSQFQRLAQWLQERPRILHRLLRLRLAIRLRESMQVAWAKLWLNRLLNKPDSQI